MGPGRRAALTTLVASTAIAPFAVFHFHRMTEYGLIANLLAAPIVSLLIMPMALLALIAMPLGLEAWPLKAMGLGITIMVGIGKWVAGWPPPGRARGGLPHGRHRHCPVHREQEM